MIYLVLAILTSAMITIVMRLSEDHISAKMPLLTISYCASMVLAGVHMAFGGQPFHGEGSGIAMGMGIISGILFVLAFLLLQLNVRRNGVVLSATFMKLGLLVPLALSIAAFGEKPGMLQLMGLLLAIAAIILINFEKEDTVMGFRLGLPLLLIAGGAADAMSKVYEQLGPAHLSDQFLFYTFVMCVIFCAILMVIRKEHPGKADILYGILIGIPNYYSARVTLKALERLPAVIVYPTYNVGALVTVTIAGLFLFHEKLGKRQWIAVALILVAMVLLNI